MIMKKEQMELKEVIKAAILEAFAELYGVATVEETSDEAPKEDEGKDKNDKGDKKKDPIRPEPNVGAGGFSLRG